MKKYFYLLSCVISLLFAEDLPESKSLITPEILEKAKAGDAKAMNQLSEEYIILQDYAPAVHWLQKAVTLGNADAKAGLGFCYFNGFRVEKDLAKALKLYEESAAENSHKGLNNLA